jgi:hypothetical protein
MQEGRPLGQPAAGIPRGRERALYEGTPWSMERFRDGPDALPVRRVSRPDQPLRPDRWTAHAQEIGYRLASLEVDFVQVQLATRDDRKRQLLDLRLEYVGSVRDARAWVTLPAQHVGLVERLRPARRSWDAVLLPPWQLPLGLPREAASPCLLVWRDPGKPIACGHLVVDLIRDSLGVSDPARVRVKYHEVDQLTVGVRMANAGRYTDRQARHIKVLAVCEKCGRDLRDPTYAAIGIGPECIKSYPAAQIRLRREMNRVVRAGSELRLNAKRPADWLAGVSEHWILPNPQ